jgi:membrane protein required for colicin V production
MSTHLTNFDYIIIAILFLSTFFALLKGFIRTLVSLIGTVLSLYVTTKLYPILLPIISKKYAASTMTAKIGTGLLSYVVALIIIGIISKFILSLTSNFRGGALDRSLGLIFGFIRGVLIACMIFLVANAIISNLPLIRSSKNKWLTESKSYFLLKSGSEVLLMFLPVDKEDKDALLGNKRDEQGGGKLTKEIYKQIIDSIPADVMPQIDQKTIDNITSGKVTEKEKEKEKNQLQQLMDKAQDIKAEGGSPVEGFDILLKELLPSQQKAE